MRSGSVWDVVKDGQCVTQMAGLNGAKQAIDELIAESEKWQNHRMRHAAHEHQPGCAERAIWATVEDAAVDLLKLPREEHDTYLRESLEPDPVVLIGDPAADDRALTVYALARYERLFRWRYSINPFDYMEDFV